MQSLELKSKKLKFSYYNILFNVGNSYFIYNTLYGSLVKINKKIKGIVEINLVNELSMEVIDLLVKSKILIDKDFNERKYIEEKIKESKKNNKKTHVFFTTTLACNCSCLYCFESKNIKNESTDFSWVAPFVKKFTLKNKSKSLLLDFFGGEPMLKWDKLSEIINELEKFGNEKRIETLFRFYTNGTILNSKMLAFFIEKRGNIKDFQITIDGPQKIHDKRRPLKIRGSAYNEIIKNIGLLHKNKMPVRLRINVDNVNVKAIPRLLKELKEYEWHKSIPIYFYCVQNLGESCRGYKAFFNDDQSSKELENLWRLALKQGFKINLKPNIKFIYCSSFNENSIVVDYQKKLYKCAVLQSPEHVIGVIKDDGDIDIIDKKKKNKWTERSSLKIEACQKCKLLPTCASGCGGSAYNKFGTQNINNCSGNKKLLFEKLRLYVKEKYEI